MILENYINSNQNHIKFINSLKGIDKRIAIGAIICDIGGRCLHAIAKLFKVSWAYSKKCYFEYLGLIAQKEETRGRKKLTVHQPNLKAHIKAIREDMEIETGFVCTERHRAFFKEYIGTGFSFNTEFQRWLKNNAGKTYAEAITAYDQICKDRKNKKKTIGKQFEYNTYIRDFFSDNQGKPMESAIICWKYKKQLQGHNRYERSDLVALESQ